MKATKEPPLEDQLRHYKAMYLKYFNESHELSSKCIEVKLRHVELKAEIASLKFEQEKEFLPFLGTISWNNYDRFRPLADIESSSINGFTHNQMP